MNVKKNTTMDKRTKIEAKTVKANLKGDLKLAKEQAKTKVKTEKAIRKQTLKNIKNGANVAAPKSTSGTFKRGGKMSKKC